jgi:solute carrier family 25 phosphate transporter 23/24/25/41
VDGSSMDDSTERQQQVKELFDKLDVDKDGRISLHDFEVALEKKGLAKESGVEELYNRKRLVPHEKGGITFGEFYNMMVFGPKDEEDETHSDPFSDWVLLGDNRVASAASPTGARIPQRNMWKYLIYGALSGAISRTATAPLERLKILVQVQDIDNRKPRYSSGVLSSLAKMWKDEGFTGYYKGNGTNCVRIMPSSAVRFYSYELYKKHLWGDIPAASLENYKRLLSGALAGITATSVTHPLDLARTRLAIQTTGQKYSGLFGTMLTVVKEEGVTGLYKGMGTSCLGVAPFVALNFASSEGLRELSKKYGYTQGVFSSLAIGSIGGIIAMTLTYPTELLRRRMMVQGIGGEPRLYNSIWDACKKIASTEGYRGFYRGMLVTYYKVIPSTAISWAVMDICARLFNEENAQQYAAQ